MAKDKIVYKPRQLTFKEKRMIVKPCNWCGKEEEDCESCS